ncbi:hypothetical protein M433DRAFT_149430 [Acidomyces richmondensis BFW]|nr:MAG: hypothetical protein FE78DRAFT_89689 [Acidomyces sp. 'richmondensis']KYG49980.1 hypothetical protein M433DRAFT_149430 [Acidomyces richmondensis BFW]
MVTRKPVGRPVETNTSPNGNKAVPNPPYPTTPTRTSPNLPELDRSKTVHSAKSVYSPDLHTSPAFDLIDMDEARSRPRRDSDVSSHGTWDSDEEEDEKEEGESGDKRDTPDEVDLPKPLRIRPSQQNMQQQAGNAPSYRSNELPAVLRPGPAEGATNARENYQSLRYDDDTNANPWVSPAPQQLNAQLNGKASSNNPYRQQVNGFGPENSQNARQEIMYAPPQPANAPPPPPPVELPTVRTPAEELSKMSLGEHNPPEAQPWQTAEILAVPQQVQPPFVPVANPSQHQNGDVFGISNPWQSDSQEHSTHGGSGSPSPNPPPKGPHQSSVSQYTPAPRPPPNSVAVTNLIDHPEQPQPPSAAHEVATSGPTSNAQVPESRSTDLVPETPQTRDRRQRGENYSIKHVTWYDAAQSLDPHLKDRMRKSPILTQNANGPCPLLALVNALVLSTPQNMDTALIETLRTREQVSLGLLLDAVFEELMSGRRGDTAQGLPDVGELYAFLLALHTGMNVNPRFITPATAPRGSLESSPPEKTLLHPVERAQTKAGCFEETKEMRLYSVFNIPLIHGWVPPKGSSAYAAFERSAHSFEEAQNIQFLEPELEDKLRTEGLSPEEQQTLQDIKVIKTFLNTWPTQLTDYGLETISASLKPGQVAILFRNDHFSTLYKEPKYGALMTLVTDAGYSTHDEIVWESLVDVNGSASEMFSGDFRAVSHQQDVSKLNHNSSGGRNEGWQTVGSRNRHSRQNRQGQMQLENGHLGDGHETLPPLPGRPGTVQPNDSEDIGVQPNAERSTSEQEDHDLALALQLQEEEEDRHRQAEERRRREQELSERFLSTEAVEGPRPPIPPRRSGNTSHLSTVPPAGRAPVNRADQNDPDAPPSYEQSASDRPYRPAGSTAASVLQQGNPLNAYDALRRQQSAYNQNSSSSVNIANAGAAGPSGHSRRQSNANRIRRRSTQFGGGPPAGSYANSPSSPSGRPVPQGVAGAAGIKDAEDKCLIM